jgi:hypothetical protein
MTNPMRHRFITNAGLATIRVPGDSLRLEIWLGIEIESDSVNWCGSSDTSGTTPHSGHGKAGTVSPSSCWQTTRRWKRCISIATLRRGDDQAATMKYTYDEKHDALGIYFRDGDYDDSEEIYDGFVIDYESAVSTVSTSTTTHPSSSISSG